jgi:hypothetical protein
MEDRVYDHLALVIGPILRDMRRRQRAILGWQIATALILLVGFSAIIGILLAGI